MNTTDAAVAIKCWVEVFSGEMYSWAFHKTGNKEIAEDIVQEAFLSAFQSFEKFEAKSHPKTWLFAIVNNLIAGYFRKQFRNPVIAHHDESQVFFFDLFFDADGNWLKEAKPEDWNTEQTHLLDDPEFLNILQACMEKLPENWSAAVKLKYLEEKKGELICQELGITATNFWQTLHRAKLQLRKCIEVHWFKK
ncbi:MAG: sigma-70 family RNA polymerase sigma factor [Bacteroidota bacterium]|nr:sigma-70 family RNA polymerase sigma factor [Bacteroidota bacterium]